MRMHSRLEPHRWTCTGAALVAGLVVKSGQVQMLEGDLLEGDSRRPPMATQAGQGSRLQDRFGLEGAAVHDSSRLRALADPVLRGTLFDRRGLPVATSDPAVLERHRTELEALGVNLEAACPDRIARCYPLEGAAFHLVGALDTPLPWGTPGQLTMEQGFDAQLRGFETEPFALMRRQPDGSVALEFIQDLRWLLPRWWASSVSSREDVMARRERDRDVRLALDARLQLRVAQILTEGVQAINDGPGIDGFPKPPIVERAAAVVLDVQTGEVLASVSYPFPRALGPGLAAITRRSPEWRDRARFGMYAPGSTFKLVTALAALRVDPQNAHVTYRCMKLEAKRVGMDVPGFRRIRDDEKETIPHGHVDLVKAIRVSCNAFFAQLGVFAVGPEALLETAALFDIRVARPNTAEELEKTLEQSAFGQGEVVAHPIQMAQVVATIAHDGRLVTPVYRLPLLPGPTASPSTAARVASALHSSLLGSMPPLAQIDAQAGRDRIPWDVSWDPAVFEEGNERLEAPDAVQVVTPAQARLIGEAMRQVVTDGTARRMMARYPIGPSAGKTGTTEVSDGLSHAWYVGFAPWTADGPARKPEGPALSVAVVVENVGYGGLYATPIAAAIFQAAGELGLLPTTSPPAEAPMRDQVRATDARGLPEAQVASE